MGQTGIGAPRDAPGGLAPARPKSQQQLKLVAFNPDDRADFDCILLSFCFFIKNLSTAKRSRRMYRCHFMRAGRIAQGCNLNVDTLDAAIATGQKILADRIEPDDCDGLEIWLDSALLYLSGRPGRPRRSPRSRG